MNADRDLKPYEGPREKRPNERLLIGAFLAHPTLLTRYPDLEIDDFITLPCRFAFEAFRNLQARGEAITIDSTLAELGDRANPLSDGRPDGERLFLEEQLAKGRAPVDIAQAHADRIAVELRDYVAGQRDVFREAQRDAQDDESTPTPLRRGKRACDMRGVIRSRAAEPWVLLRVGEDEIARLRLGAVATLTGAPGAGKSTLAAAFMLSHLRNDGAGIYVSIELDADELAARVVGMQCHASWEDVLRGHVADLDMERALNLPRLTILDGEDATLAMLEHEIGEVRVEHPRAPILVVVDYIQIVEGDEREMRARVAAVAQRLRRIAKRHSIVVLGISQPSRAAGKALGTGELLGLDTMTAMAESAEIERAAYVTLALGAQGPLRDDGTCPVDLSTGKGRMGGGDKVWPMSLDPRTGRFTVAGDGRRGSEVKTERAQAKQDAATTLVANAIPTMLAKAAAPMTRADLRARVGKNNAIVVQAIESLLDQPESGVVEVVRVGKGRGNPLWTRDRAEAAGRMVVSR